MKLLSFLWNWLDERLPVQRAWNTHMGKYYAPKNFNFWYFFGVLSLLVLVNTYHHDIFTFITMGRYFKVEGGGHALIDTASEIKLGTVAGTEKTT